MMRTSEGAGRRRARVAARATAVAVLLAAGAGGCKRGGAGDAAAADTGPTIVQLQPSDIAVVTSEAIQSGPVISGTLRARDEAQVRAQAAGTVTGVFAEQGQSVKRGQLLARIEATTAQQALISAQQGVGSAAQAYEVSRRQAERQATLQSAGAVSQQALEMAQSQAAAARAQLAGARAQLAAARKQVENTAVRAPLSGVVSARPVNAGDVVTPGTALFTVVNPSGMKLEASVPSDQLGQVRVGAPVSFTVNGYPGRTFSGTVERINPAADPATRQVPIFITIPNAGNTLVSGLFAQGRVAAQAASALVVPTAAVDQTGAFPSVLRVRGGKIEQVSVQLGAEDTERGLVAVTSGLAAGDTVLASTSQGVPAGTRVRMADAAAAPAR